MIFEQDQLISFLAGPPNQLIFMFKANRWYIKPAQVLKGPAEQHLSHLVTKPTKWHVRPAKTQISLGICPVWSESSLSTWRSLGSLATHWAHSEDSDQTGQMPRLIWVFTGRTTTLLVLAWGSSFVLVLRIVVQSLIKPCKICTVTNL